MHSIEIDDDLYTHLLRNSEKIGESASEILRRLLNLQSSADNGFAASSDRNASARATGEAPNEFSDTLSDPLLHAQQGVVGRFLFLLDRLHSHDPKGFEKVLNLSGRRRKYFGRSSDELRKYGRSVFPKKIPGSTYYVVTNNDTAKKQEILGNVMRLLGYTDAAIDGAGNALK